MNGDGPPRRRPGTCVGTVAAGTEAEPLCLCPPTARRGPSPVHAGDRPAATVQGFCSASQVSPRTFQNRETDFPRSPHSARHPLPEDCEAPLAARPGEPGPSASVACLVAADRAPAGRACWENADPHTHSGSPSTPAPRGPGADGAHLSGSVTCQEAASQVTSLPAFILQNPQGQCREQVSGHWFPFPGREAGTCTANAALTSLPQLGTRGHRPREVPPHPCKAPSRALLPPEGLAEGLCAPWA